MAEVNQLNEVFFGFKKKSAFKKLYEVKQKAMGEGPMYGEEPRLDSTT